MLPPIPDLVDCHAHLQARELLPALSLALDAARQAGIGSWLCNGTQPGDWPEVARIAATEPDVLPAYGLHPYHLAEAPADWLDRLSVCLRSGAVALGEAGLDHAMAVRDDAAQLQAFRDQLALARELNLPMVIHAVRAWGALADTLQTDGPPSPGFQLHCYGGPAEMVKRFTRLGAYFSFAGSVLDPARRRARLALAAVPLDRLLVETDAPALLPPPEFRTYPLLSPSGAPLNHPANLPAIVAGIADLRGMSPQQLALAVRANMRRLLGASCWSTTPLPAPA